MHLLWSCPNAVEIWRQIERWWDVNLKPCKADADLVKILNTGLIKLEFKDIWIIVVILSWWHIWKARNALIF